MKAFIVDHYGSADRVRGSEVPDPEVRGDDALIEIHAAGVNTDLLITNQLLFADRQIESPKRTVLRK